MARLSRVVLNRQALHEVDMAMLAGLEHLATTILDATEPPDAETGTWYFGDSQGPRAPGLGLPTRGDWVSYVDGKKVGGSGKKPRRVTVRNQGVTVVLGWGFPARFNERGTSRQPPRPFFEPVARQHIPQAATIMAPVVKPRLPRPA